MSEQQPSKTTEAENKEEEKKDEGDKSQAPSEEKAKPQTLKIKVKTAENEEVFFQVKKTTPFSKIINAYCKKTELEKASVRFSFEGKRIHDTDTPESLNMENEDMVDAMIMQVGGAPSL
eukprot:TRINITY_DN4073_c0_g1_i1.p1 TRINITY_DN4073_c0_g1~~TRINITY_DN4073_c0_g1_i1.p1  ORF type:complete len:119 (+),score=30.07 TRINITY_DN4073_c0_g1_i1:52-408(+)